MLGNHRSDGSKLVGKFNYTAWNSKFYDKNAIVKGPVLKDYLPATLKSQGHKSKICTQQNHLINYFYNYRDSNYINLPNFPDTLFVPEATRQWKRQNL